MNVLKRPISNLSDTIGDIPKPNIGDYERGQKLIDEAEEKHAEAELTTAKRKIKNTSRQTLDLLEEVKELRRQCAERDCLALESTI